MIIGSLSEEAICGEMRGVFINMAPMGYFVA